MDVTKKALLGKPAGVGDGGRIALKLDDKEPVGGEPPAGSPPVGGGGYIDAKNDVPVEKTSSLTAGVVAGAKNPMALLLAQKARPPKALPALPPRAHAERLAAITAKRAPPDGDWLLAAHLSQWMDNTLYAGASLDELAKSFLAAHPMARQRYPALDGAAVRALQERFTFMPSWSTSPEQVPHGDAGTWGDLAGHGSAQTSLEQVQKMLSEVPLAMELTSKLAARLAPEQPFKNANVVMVQHMLGQAHPLVDSLRQCGMDPAKAEYVGVPYQKNPAVRATLENAHGVKVTVPERGNIDDMYKVICEAVDRAYERHLQNGEPILILDDGGYASKYIATQYKDKQHLFTVVEQTTRGLTEISKLEGVKFPIINVAGSYGKRFESAQVGDAVKMAVRGVLESLTATPTRKDVLVVGAGKVGEGVADSFLGDGARVTIYDPFITPVRRRALEKKGFIVITDKVKALDQKFLVIGCSGHRSIDMKDFLAMSSPVFVASASSKRVEIDTLGLGELATDKEGKLRKFLATRINEQETYHYWLKDGRIVTAMADGLPVNFQRINSIAPELIDHTMSLMLLGAAQAMKERRKPDTEARGGLVELDPTEQFWLQAEMEGIKEGTTSADPQAITISSGAHTYTASREDWMKIASSPATPPEVLHDLAARFLGADEVMDPLLLEVLGARHELSDATVDAVIDGHVIGHMTRLLANELLSEAQVDRVIDWLIDAFDVNVWHEDRGPVARLQAVAVEGSAENGWYFYWPRLQQIGDTVHLVAGTSDVADRLTEQISLALASHPRCPEGLRFNALVETRRTMQVPSPSNVLLVRNTAWKPRDFERFAANLHDIIWHSTNGSPAQMKYAGDLIDAIIEHPSVSEATIERMTEARKELVKNARARKVRLVHADNWDVHAGLGIRVPDYTTI